MPPYDLTWAALLAAAVVTVLSAGRLTRLVTADSWPPVLWAKDRWVAWTSRGPRREGWQVLLFCHWCFGPWATLLIGGWAVLSDLHWTWWAVNGWLGLSYLTSILVHHDEGNTDEQP